MQAITTSFSHGTAGPRITAIAQAGRAVVPFDHALSSEANHRAAATKLANRNSWLIGCVLYTGMMADDRMCHVIVERRSLKCTAACDEPASHISEKGFIYCADHARFRHNSGLERCRAMTAEELAMVMDAQRLSFAVR